MDPAGYIDYFQSPTDWLRLQCTDSGLTEVHFMETAPEAEALETIRPHALLHHTKQELASYYSGTLKHFAVPLAPQGTVFQQKVWQALTQIPYGITWSYRELSVHLGDLKAIRAVGRANGQNPIAIIVPCHRVIGADGSLTGYAGGLHRKKWLLQHENARPRGNQLSLGF